MRIVVIVRGVCLTPGVSGVVCRGLGDPGEGGWAPGEVLQVMRGYEGTCFISLHLVSSCLGIQRVVGEGSL